MPDAIVYCDHCHRIIQPSDVSDGRAIVGSTASLCPDCLAHLPKEKLASIQRAAAAGDAATPSTQRAKAVSGTTYRAAVQERIRRRRPTEQVQPAQSSSGMKTAIVVGLGGFAFVIIVAILVMNAQSPYPSSMAPPPLTTPQVLSVPRPTAPIAPLAPLARKPLIAPTPSQKPTAVPSLERIRAMVTPNLGKYEEIRRRLTRIIEESAGTPEDVAATQLLDELDARYAKLAEEALAGAIEAGRALVLEGEVDVAVSGVRSVARRFRDGPWLESTGKGLIEQAVAEISEEKPKLPEKRAEAGGTGQLVPRVRSLEYLGGGRFEVTYEWHVGIVPDADYDVFVHFTDPAIGSEENIAFGDDYAPKPRTSKWLVGTIVEDGPHRVTVAVGSAATRYPFVVGLYDGDKRFMKELVGSLVVERDRGRVTGVRFEE